MGRFIAYCETKPAMQEAPSAEGLKPCSQDVTAEEKIGEFSLVV